MFISKWDGDPSSKVDLRLSCDGFACEQVETFEPEGKFEYYDEERCVESLQDDLTEVIIEALPAIGWSADRASGEAGDKLLHYCPHCTIERNLGKSTPIIAGHSFRRLPVDSIELAEAMKLEILWLVLGGDIPASIRCYSDLHDYVDANCIGGMDQVYAALREGTDGERNDAAQRNWQELCEMANPAIDAVDGWIKAGWLRRDVARLPVYHVLPVTDGRNFCITETAGGVMRKVADGIPSRTMADELAAGLRRLSMFPAKGGEVR